MEYSTLMFDFQTNGSINRQFVRFKKTGYKTFFNAQHLLYHLNGKEYCFLNFLIEVANTKGEVYIDCNLKNKFIQFLIEKVKINRPISEDSITRIVSKLKKLGLIIDNDLRASYTINPKYFWRGPEYIRLKRLRSLIMQRISSRKPVNHLIDQNSVEFVNHAIELEPFAAAA